MMAYLDGCFWVLEITYSKRTTLYNCFLFVHEVTITRTMIRSTARRWDLRVEMYAAAKLIDDFGFRQWCCTVGLAEGVHSD
jgi:hypothetical protein